MECIKEKTVNGLKVVEFLATPKMRLFSYAISCDPKYMNREPGYVCRGLGMAENTYAKWCSHYNPYFEEWLDECRHLFRTTNTAKMLEFVGLERAYKGDFQFWKPFALKHKVIDAETTNVNLLPSNLSAFGDLDEAGVDSLRNTLLGGLRAMEDQRGHDLAESPPESRPESDARGTSEVPLEPVVLDASLGLDRERPLEDEHTL